MTRKGTIAPASAPTPVTTDSRICFAIAYYATEQEANLAGDLVRRRGDTYNGGFFHGMSCGRDAGFDYVDGVHGALFAVTTR